MFINEVINQESLCKLSVQSKWIWGAITWKTRHRHSSPGPGLGRLAIFQQNVGITPRLEAMKLASKRIG